MVRKLFGVLCVALVLCIGAVLADEIMGSIVKVDTAKKTVTVKDKDGKETTYDLDAKVEYPPQRGKAKGEVGDPGTLETLKTSVEKAADAGRGYNAKLTRDEKTKKVTKIEAVRGGKGKGGGGQ